MIQGLAKKKQSDARSTEEVSVNIQCPCGLVRAYVSMTAGLPGSVRFHSVPAFAFALGRDAFCTRVLSLESHIFL